MLGFLSVSTSATFWDAVWTSGFNPVLGFLSVSTLKRVDTDVWTTSFQSRAGFSECLDMAAAPKIPAPAISFNPVLGFLSVST